MSAAASAMQRFGGDAIEAVPWRRTARPPPGLDPVPVRACVIAGGGVAGLETLLALRALAADRVDVTLLAPELKFVNRSMAVEQPFKPQRVRGLRLADTAAELDARWYHGALDRVEHDQRRIITKDGDVRFDTTCSSSRSAPTPSANGTRTQC